MKERLLEFLRNENKSSAQLAEEIGVQASGISHILSGRNNPSLDFVLRMLAKYPFISTEWLLFGKGSMYKESKMPTLFDFHEEDKQNEVKSSVTNPSVDSKEASQSKTADISKVPVTKLESAVVKIVWFYENNTFDEYFPRN
jgi:transcriptional regulator with XRE-family HTH domain